MKKLVITLLLCGTLFPLLWAGKGSPGEKAKKFHFFYVSFSDMSNKAYVINALTDSLANLSAKNDEFLLFISNGKNSSFYSDPGQSKSIVTELNSINPYAPNVKLDYDKVMEYLNSSDIVFTSNSTKPLQMSFAGASFNYFIDEKYFDECNLFFIDRFMNVNEFGHLKSKENISITFLLEKSTAQKLPLLKSDYKINFYTF